MTSGDESEQTPGQEDTEVSHVAAREVAKSRTWFGDWTTPVMGLRVFFVSIFFLITVQLFEKQSLLLKFNFLF